MDAEATQVCEQIFKARCPEEIFGTGRLNEQEIKAIFRQLSMVVHPDRQNGNDVAKNAFVRLNSYYDLALKKLQSGNYGDGLDELGGHSQESGFSIKTRKNEYQIDKTLAEGDLSVVYGGVAVGKGGFSGRIAAKVVDEAKNNDLMLNEVRVLKMFQAGHSNQSKHLPVLLDQFKTKDDQLGTIMEYIDGYDLYSIREGSRWKDGIDRRHIVWMLNRSLSALGYAHSLGLVHGNIDPSHIIIRPRDHNAWIIDWCYTAINPARTHDGFRVYNEDFSAPEVSEKKLPVPASDLYSLGKTMIYALGGDVKTNKMPSNVEAALQRFLLFFVRESPRQRAQDAWEMHEELNKLIIDLWGPKKFREFKV
jgi:serine/threonine protein kinase